MTNHNTSNTSFLLADKLSAMVKWLSIFAVTLVISSGIFAQKTLIIGGISPKLYILHKVVPKENFYSIGRLYNVSPKELAAYNNLQFENGLNIGESLKIPLTESNFSQSEPAGAGEVLVPVYHAIQPKEGLYRVSINYNKVPIPSLKKWNHLQADAVSAGTPLIVGYLKVLKDESPLAGKGVRPDMDAAVVIRQEPKQENAKSEGVKQESAKPENVKPDVTPERLPPVKNPEVVKQESKEVPQKEEPKSTVTTVKTKSNINFSGGYFKKLYDTQVENKSPVNENGSGATFKSTSGWQDGKYYCFNNDAPPGTIIRITDYATGKSVYAKVLDAIPDIKQNSGLAVIMSNAAAEELGAEDSTFNCSLSYVK